METPEQCGKPAQSQQNRQQNDVNEIMADFTNCSTVSTVVSDEVDAGCANRSYSFSNNLTYYIHFLLKLYI